MTIRLRSYDHRNTKGSIHLTKRIDMLLSAQKVCKILTQNVSQTRVSTMSVNENGRLPEKCIIYGFSYENMKIGDKYVIDIGGILYNFFIGNSILTRVEEVYFQSMFPYNPLYSVFIQFMYSNLYCPLARGPITLYVHYYEPRSLRNLSFHNDHPIFVKDSQNSYLSSVHTLADGVKHNCKEYIYYFGKFAELEYSDWSSCRHTQFLQEKELLERKREKRRRLFPSMFMGDE